MRSHSGGKSPMGISRAPCKSAAPSPPFGASSGQRPLRAIMAIPAGKNGFPEYAVGRGAPTAAEGRGWRIANTLKDGAHAGVPSEEHLVAHPGPPRERGFTDLVPDGNPVPVFGHGAPHPFQALLRPPIIWRPSALGRPALGSITCGRNRWPGVSQPTLDPLWAAWDGDPDRA